MSAPNQIPERAKQYAEKMRREVRRRKTQWSLMVLGALLLLVACVVAAYLLAIYQASRPQQQPFDLHYIALRDWDVSYRFSVPESSLPRAVREQPEGERLFPRVVIKGEPEKTRLPQTAKTGTILPLEIVIPAGALAGSYFGELVLEDKQGSGLEQRLPLRIDVLDVFANLRPVLAYFGLVTLAVFAISFWLHPLPIGFVRILSPITSWEQPAKQRLRRIDLPRNTRSRYFWFALLSTYAAAFLIFRPGLKMDAASPTALGVGAGCLTVLVALFFWADPFGRSRVSLRELNSNMPEGEIETSRNSLVGGERNMGVVMRFWDENQDDLRLLHACPESTREVAICHEKPQPTIGVPKSTRDRRGITIIARLLQSTTDEAFAFSYLREEEPTLQPHRQPTSI